MSINTESTGRRLECGEWARNVRAKECEKTDQNSKHSVASDTGDEELKMEPTNHGVDDYKVIRSVLDVGKVESGTMVIDKWVRVVFTRFRNERERMCMWIFIIVD